MDHREYPSQPSPILIKGRSIVILAIYQILIDPDTVQSRSPPREGLGALLTHAETCLLVGQDISF